MTTENYNLATVCIYGISAFIALIMLGVAIRQLSKLAQQVTEAVKSNSINQLNALLSLEGQISERRLELGKAGIALSEMTDQTPAEKVDIYNLRFNEAKEMYLNSLDRLCYCVDKKLFQDNDMRLEYRETLKSALHDFPEDFGMATPYRNIKKIYEAWANQ